MSEEEAKKIIDEMTPNVLNYVYSLMKYIQQKDEAIKYLKEENERLNIYYKDVLEDIDKLWVQKKKAKDFLLRNSTWKRKDKEYGLKGKRKEQNILICELFKILDGEDNEIISK